MGGLMGVRLHEAGHEVSFMDLSNKAEFINKHGIRLKDIQGNISRISVRASDKANKLGTQDVVVLSVKANQLEAVAPSIEPLLETHTSIVSLQNGLPWWYFEHHGGEYDGHQIKCLDPTGIIRKYIPANRIIGCVAYPAAETIQPGLIRHVEGDRFALGELDGALTDRCAAIADALSDAGFRSRVIEDIRAEHWLKAWGSLSFNPISALTRATMVDIATEPSTRSLVHAMMSEAELIANKLGIQFRHTIEKRIKGAEGVGHHKTSMLQDVENGRALELEALMGCILELADLTGVSAPHIRSVYACTILLDKQIQCTVLAGTTNNTLLAI